jgi:hypothetical protein
MRIYRENEIVIYTDKEGNRIDTFVIFDTDKQTGLTHINHLNLKVKDDELELHPHSSTGRIPIADSLSFELFKQLKEKFIRYDQMGKTNATTLYRDMKVVRLFAEAS